MHTPAWVSIRGKASHEFLVAAAFTRSEDAAGNIETAVNIRDATPLTKGTDCDRITEACRSQWPTLRQDGHRGGAVEAYCFDRKGWHALSRRVRQFHALLAPSWTSPTMSSSLLWMYEIIIIVACAAHDAQNSLKWSMKAEYDDKELMRDCWVGIESVRKSFDVIIMYLGSWVIESLTFAPPWDA